MATILIKKHIQQYAANLRNSEDYDDFDYGTEPIPGDKTWVKRKKQCGKCRLCTCKAAD